MLAALEQTAEPQPSLGVLSHAEQVLTDCRPASLDQERRALIDDIDEQFAVARDEPVAAP